MIIDVWRNRLLKIDDGNLFASRKNNFNDWDTSKSDAETAFALNPGFPVTKAIPLDEDHIALLANRWYVIIGDPADGGSIQRMY